MFLFDIYSEISEISSSERSILVVRTAKYGPLKEPIRMLLFTMDQFSQITKVLIAQASPYVNFKYIIALPAR